MLYLCFNNRRRDSFPPRSLTGSKVALDRTLDVFKLQELSEDPDPHATLPFISHHTLNISRELDEKGTRIVCPVGYFSHCPFETLCN